MYCNMDLKIFRVSIFMLGCFVAIEATADIIQSWTGGFKGKFTIPITEPTGGTWTVRLQFSKEVKNFQIWNADALDTLDDGATYIVGNKPWNGNIDAGGKIEMEFMARKTGRDPSVTAELVSDPKVSPTAEPEEPNIDDATYDYGEVLRLSILFFEAQRSGKLPDDNRVSWRKDSALGDKGDNGEDLTGGWYDAGDYVKFGFPMASSATNLIWGLLEFQKGYEAAGQYDEAVTGVKWALDYFIKCHVADNEFYGQVGDGNDDHAFWGRPEDMTMVRPAFKLQGSNGGSDLTGETAAAMAAGSILFENIDPDYSAKLLDHAKRLFNFAYNNRGLYHDSITDASQFYRSSGYKDELCWGAMWLYKATSDNKYLQWAKSNLPTSVPWAFSWDDKNAGCLVLLHEMGVTETLPLLEGFLNQWFPGGVIKYTPGGLAWRDQWGSLRYSANAALVALISAKHGVLTSKGRDFATKQIGYMLGDNGRSFVVGFGGNPPQRPHHSSSACQSAPAPCDWSDFSDPAPNAHVLYGALVGGPDDSDNYSDDRSNYISNEVTCDYNAGFQGVLAGLKEMYG